MQKISISYTYSSIWKVAYPIFLTLLVQNLIQVINTAFLGRVGEVELGASALGGIYYIVLFMLAFGFSTGSQILIGRRNGEKRFHKTGEIVINGMVFLLCMALGLFLFTFFCSRSVLSSMLTSPHVLEAALEYLHWRIFGIFFASINVMFRAFYVGTTNTRILSINALIMALTNILFDYLLIFGNGGFPEMGIAGAGLASVISEGVSVLFFMLYTILRIDLKKYGFLNVKVCNGEVVKHILDISLSLMLQNFLSLGSWFLFFLAIEHLGEQPLAISNIVRSLYMLISIPVFALAATANTLVSNTIGSGRKDEVIGLIWKVATFAAMICLAFMSVVFLFPETVLRIYTSDPELIRSSIPSLLMLLPVLPLMSVSNVFFNAVSGTGNTRTALALEIFTLVIYIFFIWLSVMHWKFPLEYCWTCEYVYAVFIFLFSFLYMKRGNWRSKVI